MEERKNHSWLSVKFKADLGSHIALTLSGQVNTYANQL